MITGRTIVCIGSNWEYDPTSKHHIMRVLSRRNDILWVNYHGTRRPRLSRTDIRSSVSVLRRMVRGVQEVGPNFRLMTPLVIPGARGRWISAANRELLTQQIREALASIPGSATRPTQVWSFAPDVPFLAGQFGEEAFIYYCVDDHAEFDGVDAARITCAENETIDRANLVITTSEALQHAKRFRRPDCVLVRHGVDYERFATAWRTRLSTPADLVNIPRPLFGFFGLIQSWIDLELVAEVAKMRPQYSFVLIGECQRDTSPLRGLRNVYLLGRRSNAELPAFCAAFSAGLMPFVRNPLARSINPIKMYEYLAAGLPVISTPLPEAERYAEAITFADRADEFAHACDNVLTLESPGRRERISALVAAESWESKVAHLSDLVLRRLSVGRTRTVPKAGIAPLDRLAAYSSHEADAAAVID